ncbi:MAG TPA: aldose 1-epimerase [Ruminiclostridium sp.]|nr:aldose 1-epimerase [Ruminiclostridium sp.]
MHFDYKKFDRKGLEIVSLYYIDEESNDRKEIWVSPGHGMNLCRYKVNGLTIVDFDPDEVRDSFSGNPLLYPTPNRVLDGVFTYKGKQYPQVRNGKPIMINGLVHNEPFRDVEVSKTEDSISISAHIDFYEKNHLYQSFPFSHRLDIAYTLDKAGARFSYSIESHEKEESIPYGIAIQPFFKKIDGDTSTVIRAPYRFTYKTTKDLIPTGELVPVDDDTDLSDYRSVGALNLDTVFTGNQNNEPASIIYSRTGLKITLECSSDFTHMVICTPKDKPFFCMENQTCATNAHNLYEQGRKEISGLKFVEPGSRISGYVKFTTERI